MGGKGNRRPCDGRLGARIAWWREQARMTRAQMARVLSRPASAITYWESGQYEPSFEQLERYAEVVGAGSLAGFFAARVPHDFVPMRGGRRTADATTKRAAAR